MALDRRFGFAGADTVAGAGAGSGSAFWFCRRRCRADAGAGSVFCFAGASHGPRSFQLVWLSRLIPGSSVILFAVPPSLVPPASTRIHPTESQGHASDCMALRHCHQSSIHDRSLLCPHGKRHMPSIAGSPGSSNWLFCSLELFDLHSGCWLQHDLCSIIFLLQLMF